MTHSDLLPYFLRHDQTFRNNCKMAHSDFQAYFLMHEQTFHAEACSYTPIHHFGKTKVTIPSVLYTGGMGTFLFRFLHPGKYLQVDTAAHIISVPRV